MSVHTKQPLLVFENIDVAIDGTTVLRDVSWRLEPGEHWGLIGANGSGKSSFLRLVAGSLWPTPGRGTRRYDFGQGEQTDAVAAKSRITLVGHELQDQYTRWGWNFTALDVVLSGIFRTDVPRRRPAAADTIRARALMRELALTDLAERPFLELSRGEQRRVLIARGLAYAPAVLLLDEPASGLDQQARRDLHAMISHVAAHTTLVCAAHSEEELPPIATRIIRLRNGRITGVASTARAGTPPGEDFNELRADDVAPASTGEIRHCATRPLIEIERADVWLRQRRVLRDLHWRMQPDQHWLIRGPNGAGKSTLLRLLHGQLQPARGGRIRWPGLGNPRSVWELRRRVAWVSPELQAAYLHPTTVRQCLASGFTASIGQVRELTAREAERVECLLDGFGLAQLASRQLKDLSYGQRHRALIARAFASAPTILLLDEPWEGLDSATRRLVRDQLDVFAAGGGRLVCISHIGDGGFDFSHELVLKRGRIAETSNRLTDSLSGAAHLHLQRPATQPAACE